MFTITGVHHYGDEENDLIRLEKNFRELRKHLKRKFPEFQYFAIKEFSPDGNWHYHGLWNIRFDWYEFRELWEKISGSSSVYFKKVYGSKGAINYIFKYAFKSVNNKRELQQLYENDKRKFSSSKGLLTRHKDFNPYVAQFGVDYSTEDLKTELYNIIRNSSFCVADFSGSEYPYFEDLLLNLFDKFINEHPPNLFYSVRLASLGESFCA